MKLKRYASICALIMTLALLLSAQLKAEDWPTYNHDYRRSASTTEKLDTPLHLQWSYQAKLAPRPAWPAPAKTDYWHREANIQPRVVYDRAFQLISIGDNIYFGSSADDKVYCLDAQSGAEKWSFFTGGPVRLAPSYADGRLYFGSDDGFAYCLDAKTGDLVWKIDARAQERLIPGNERMISINPIRTDLLVENDEATFFSGFLVNEEIQLLTVHTKDGAVIRRSKNLGLSPQGYLLASHDKLFAPTGRTTPQIFSRKEGKNIGVFRGHGGTFALLADDELIYGGGDMGYLNDKSVDKQEQVATFEGLQMIINNGVSYLRSATELSAVNRGTYLKEFPKWEKTAEKKNDLAEKLWDLREQRKIASKENARKIDLKIIDLVEQINSIDEKKQDIEAGGLLWKMDIDESYSMILAGNLLFLGGVDKVTAIETTSGTVLWSDKVIGDVYGLAAANGRLLASTSAGYIYSYATQNTSPQTIKPQIAANPYTKIGDNTLYAEAISNIKQTGINKGYCLVVGSELGRLAYEIAQNTNLTVIGIEEDAAKVEKSRRLLDQAGLYGSRVSIQQGSLENLPYSKYFANLIVSETMLLTQDLKTSAAEISRLLKPYGGVACIGSPGAGNQLNEWKKSSDIPGWHIKNGDWAMVTRGPIEGAGEWTHLYANASNTSSSLDPVKPPLQVQWFGQPGPRNIINRHSRPMSTLFKDGRLFVPGDNRVIAVDAYNGTPLWQQIVPNSRVLGALKDCGTMAVTEDYLYIAAEDACRALDVTTGENTFTLKAPQLISGEIRDWGYTAIVDDQIFGSGKKRGASFTILGRFNCDDFEGDFREMVMSDYLFSLDRKSGRTLWTYNDGVVFNNTITIGGDYIYFIKSKNEKAIKDLDGRIRIDHFCEGPTYIVKLDKKSGKMMWEKPYSFPFEQIMYLSFSQNVLLTTGSFNKGKDVHYGLYAFDGDSGKELWQQSYTGGNSRWQQTTKSSTGGSHGEQWQHPVIIKDTVYLPPHNFNLFTGKVGDLVLTRGGGGCGGLSGSATNLFARGSNPRIYDITGGDQSGTPITRVSRPGCWINIIPAGNVVSIPESSSGCTCDYPVQTSFVFVSKN